MTPELVLIGIGAAVAFLVLQLFFEPIKSFGGGVFGTKEGKVYCGKCFHANNEGKHEDWSCGKFGTQIETPVGKYKKIEERLCIDVNQNWDCPHFSQRMYRSWEGFSRPY